MSLIQALILGIVQGLTEFIPVSSSGHLVLFQQWLGVTEQGLAFDVALHFGTLLAILITFNKDIVQLGRSLFVKSEYTKLAWFIAFATLPAVIVGVLLESRVESTFRSDKLVAFNLIAVAILMLLAERYARRYTKPKALKKTNLKQALAVGAAQAVAVIPGVSRSGSTITMGLVMGMDRVAAMRFSFLLGIPVIFGAIAKVILVDSGWQAIGDDKGIFIVGIVTAFISGSLAIQFLLRYLSKHTLHAFAWYRIALGLLVLLISVL